VRLPNSSFRGDARAQSRAWCRADKTARRYVAPRICGPAQQAGLVRDSGEAQLTDELLAIPEVEPRSRRATAAGAGDL